MSTRTDVQYQPLSQLTTTRPEPRECGLEDGHQGWHQRTAGTKFALSWQGLARILEESSLLVDWKKPGRPKSYAVQS